MRNLQEQVKKHSVTKNCSDLTRNCSSDLKKLANSWHQAPYFKSFFSITRTIFSHSRSEQLRYTKYHFWTYHQIYQESWQKIQKLQLQNISIDEKSETNIKQNSDRNFDHIRSKISGRLKLRSFRVYFIILEIDRYVCYWLVCLIETY